MSANLNVSQVAEGQASPEVTVNDATAALDAALTERRAIDLTNSVTVTAAQYRAAIYFDVTTTGASKTLTLPAVKRLVIVKNNGTLTFGMVVGSTTINLPIGFEAVVFTDGTTNGLTATIIGRQIPAGGNGSAAQAIQTLTASGGNFADTETVTIGTYVYTAQTSFTAAKGHFLIGALAIDSLTNLARCINQSGAGGGTLYDNVHTDANDIVTATEESPLVITARKAGTRWNATPTTETATHMAWGAVTMAGGADKQVLRKLDNTDYDVEWGDLLDAPNGVPPGGAAGYSLQKATSGDYNMIWVPTSSVPVGGSTNQVLTKQSNADFDFVWAASGAATNGLPVGGSTGNMLRKSSGTDFDAAWVAGIPTGGSTGQVLEKASATDYDMAWTTPAGGDGLTVTLVPVAFSTFGTNFGPDTITQTDYAGKGFTYAMSGGSANVLSGYFKAAPTGTTWTVTCRMRWGGGLFDSNIPCIVLRDNTGGTNTGRCYILGKDTGSIFINRQNSLTSFNGSAINKTGMPWLTVFVRITYDGTNIAWDLSDDGVTWLAFFTEGKTAWLGSKPNQVGFGFNPASGGSKIVMLGVDHYVEV